MGWLTLLVLLLLALRGVLTLGALVALIYGLGRLRSLAEGMTRWASDLEEYLPRMEQLREFLALEPERAPSPARRPPRPLRRGVRFEDVSFRYPGADGAALAGVTFTLHPQERLALVGENGAGKTTLVRLLLGLYRPTGGTITVDGIDLTELDPVAWRREATAVFQDFMRYPATVAENIAYGDPALLPAAQRAGEQVEERLIAAAAQSGADGFIRGLPAGYATQLGTEFAGAVDLSAGQWQRLALARAYLRDAQIIILDEPTAALDPRAEVAVYRQFRDAAGSRCAIFISHRLGSARLAHRILVLRGGELVEEGTHDALLGRRRRIRADVPVAGELVPRHPGAGGGSVTGGTGRRTHLAALPRALRVLWDASPAATLAVGVLSAGTGLFAVAEVHVVRRLVETAGHVVAGSAPVADALLWGAAVVALVVAAAAADAVQRLASDRHRERALLIIEEGCYRHVQSVPLERLEDAGHYDRLQRARRGMAHRFEATTNFFWWSVRDGVVLVSLLVYLGRVHWILPLVLALGTTPGLLFRTRFYYLNYTLAREQVPDERRRSAINGLLLGRAAAAEIRLFALGDWLIAASQRLWARLRGERLRLGAREARALVAGDGMNAVTYLAAIVAAVLVLPPGVAAIGIYAALFVAIESFQARYAELAQLRVVAVPHPAARARLLRLRGRAA